ncbi:MAG: hypothetical protein HY931_03075 [Candidatus Falkowbacteria bacterium]|nr:MAG: hypothetical protein HY931_03075 [Candidatus Falkowbacteria bacterium]
MKKVILLSELTFNSCLTYATVRLWNWGDYDIKVSFVPLNDLNGVISQAIELYDIVIAMGYRNIDPYWPDNKNQLVVLAPREDEQGGKLFLVPSKQKLTPKTVELIKKIEKIANKQINDGIRIDLLSYLSNNESNRAVIDYLNLQRRYFQALSVVKRFYGKEEQLRLHKFFLLEILDEPEDENQWLDALIAEYDSAENQYQKPLPLMLELNVN